MASQPDLIDEGKITGETVRADFNDPTAVIHYARAAHFLGLWLSERLMIERFFPSKSARLLEAGCGAGRVTLGLWHMGYENLSAFDIAEEPLDQAKSLAGERGARTIRFFHADATKLADAGLFTEGLFDGVLFMFNGFMQIPGRANRRLALGALRRSCRAGAPFLFTTHDRDSSAGERELWRIEADTWKRGAQDPRLLEFGDRYFRDEAGATFMHLPDRAEVISDLGATGWRLEFDAMRRELADESRAVRNFSDECRFWLARAV